MQENAQRGRQNGTARSVRRAPVPARTNRHARRYGATRPERDVFRVHADATPC